MSSQFENRLTVIMDGDDEIDCRWRDNGHKSKVFIPVNGRPARTSYVKFETQTDAQAYWWALAKCRKPRLVFLLALGDGFVANTTIRHKDIPPHLIHVVNANIGMLNNDIDPLSFYRDEFGHEPRYNCSPVVNASGVCGRQFEIR